MTTRWFRVYDDLVDDPKVQMLPASIFRKSFLAALQGEDNEFSHFVRRGRDRPSGPVWEKLRSATFERDDFTCQYCGDRGGRLECDHIMPVSRGGSNDIENLATACFGCNRSKRSKTLEEWLT
jgi:hypothetical protein